jgi:hypothetical protein
MMDDGQSMRLRRNSQSDYNILYRNRKHTQGRETMGSQHEAQQKELTEKLKYL